MGKEERAIEDLERRIAALERSLGKRAAGNGGHRGSDRELYCSAPQPTPIKADEGISLERARLLLRSTKKWVNGTVLHYHFLASSAWSPSSEEKDIVREGFEVWKDVGIGLGFEEVSSLDDSEIRIGFLPGDGYWSYIGRDVLQIGQHERTMNFGSDLRQDPRRVDVPVHEIGHTLGFPHEHQNPFAGIVWNRDAVIDYFSRPPNGWDVPTIEHNILNKLPASEVGGSAWDPDSIMHYAFQAGLIDEPAEYRQGLFPEPGLSPVDEEQVRVFYPPTAPPPTELRPYDFQQLSIAPGGQKDFTINPTATREYSIQTFGASDAVIVLFEERDGSPQFVAGDDDSGWGRNARLHLRLYAGSRYILRIRLYYQWASGETAVLLW